MLVMKPSTLQSAHRGLLAVGGLSMALLFLYSGRGPLPESPPRASRAVTAGDLPSDVHSQRWQDCRRLLRMTDTHFNWESDDDNGREHGRCRRTQRSNEDLRENLRKLKEIRGRAARLVFIGDSRIRNLLEILAERLELKPLNSSNMDLSYIPIHSFKEEIELAMPSRESLPKLRAGCVEANVHSAKPLRIHCSVKFMSDTLESDFWWRPYLDGRFADQLDKVLAECAMGNCPDLVILNSGAWYARPVTLQFPIGHAVARATSFTEDIGAIRAKIARLAARTRVLWKSNEHFMSEPLYSREKGVTRTLMVLSSVIYETASRVPELNVWSSGYVEAMRFYHQVCRPNWQKMRKSNVDPVRDECEDPMHVGSTERWKQAKTILNVLFRDITEPVEGLCCGG